jgi:hypothetical protein
MDKQQRKIEARQIQERMDREYNQLCADLKAERIAINQMLDKHHCTPGERAHWKYMIKYIHKNQYHLSIVGFRLDKNWTYKQTEFLSWFQKIAEDTDEERNYLHQQRKDFLEATKFNAENFDYGQVYGPGSLEWCWQEMEKAHTERMKQNIMCAVKRDHFKANICVCKLYKLKSK